MRTLARNVKKPRKRQRREKTDWEKARDRRRSSTPRHVIPRVELSLSETQERYLLSQMKSTAYVKRRVRAHCRKALEQLRRDKRWYETRMAYHTAKESTEKAKTAVAKAVADGSSQDEVKELERKAEKGEQQRKGIADELEALQAQHRLTFGECREIASHYSGKTGLPAVFGLSVAEDVWRGVEKVLYSDGRKLDSKWEDMVALRSKQAEKAIILKAKNGGVVLKMRDVGTISLKEIPDDDQWLANELDALVSFLVSKGVAEKEAVDFLLETGEVVSVPRPCYVTMYAEEIRGRLRFFANITMEGDPLPKTRADGSPRHHLARTGRLGTDIGVSTYAAVTDGHVEMANIGERGGRRGKNNRKRKALLQRKMATSLRENNPDNYNEDGTIKRGHKTWFRSKHYRAYQAEYRDICRREHLSREYAIREQVNHLRSLGSEMVTEDQSVASWTRRAKPGKARKTKGGKKRFASRKRFGKTVQRFAPGLFTRVCKEKFGDGFIIVDKKFRASQYDHESGEYVKKPLSQRKHYHSMGRASPRDAYSAFLLYCTASGYESPDRGLCNDRFEEYMLAVTAMIADYEERGVKVRNSGF